MNKKIILGVEISDLIFSEVIEKVRQFLRSKKQHYIVTPNPEFIMQARKDKEFRIILNEADIAVPDGIGIKYAGWILGQPIKQRITGVDLTWKICELAEKEGASIFLLGGSQGVAQKAGDKIKASFKNIKIVGADMGTENLQIANRESQIKIVEKVNAAKPDILFVAFGAGSGKAPKQEKFIKYNLEKMPSVKVAVGVGGTFNYISGQEKYAPKIIRRLGLEWLYRLFTQPWRWKRIYTAVIRFPLLALKWRFRIWTSYRKNVACFIVNKQGKVFMGFRVKYFKCWQIPQGGIEKKESIKQAAERETSEELGIEKYDFKVLKIYKNFHKYIWPKNHQLIDGYKGQKQSLAIIQYLGKDNFDFTIEKEMGDYRWVDVDKIADSVAPRRKEMVEEAVALYKSLVGSL